VRWHINRERVGGGGSNGAPSILNARAYSTELRVMRGADPARPKESSMRRLEDRHWGRAS
jgi:hypothetical protein